MTARRPKLAWQIFPYFLLITLLSLWGLGWFATRQLRQFQLTQLRQDLEARAALLRDLVAPHMQNDLQAVSSLCQHVSEDTHSRATVVLPGGAVIGESHHELRELENHGDRPEVVAALAGHTGMSTRVSETTGLETLYVAVPIRLGGRIEGASRVGVTTTAIERTLGGLQRQVAGAGVTMALLAAGLVWWTSRRIAAPLERMREGAERFARGQLDFRLELPETREFAGVAAALNGMAGELQSRLAEIRRQHDESEAVLASMDEGVLALDVQGRVLRLNQAATTMLALGEGPVVGRPIREVTRNPDLLRFLAHLRESGQSMERHLTLHTEPECHLQATGTPLRSPEGQPLGLLVVLNDVTRLRRLEGMRRDFVANVSHELRTPITSIKGFVETLLDGGEHAAEDIRRFHAIILKHANRLNSIIDDLLKLSRIEQDQEKGLLEKEVVPAGDLLEGLAQFYTAAAEAKGIRLEVAGGEVGEVFGNHALLDQAVGNLVDNAIKYSPAGTVVRLAARGRPEGGVELRVTDEGPGIEAQHLPRLFERFYRVDKSRSRQVGGTGLGLAIVKHIALAHGGEAGVESRVGGGSTFWIRLPPAAPAA
jgi:two-component system phosphate regulon sensor histidine kinase PhoR